MMFGGGCRSDRLEGSSWGLPRLDWTGVDVGFADSGLAAGLERGKQ